MRYLLEIFSICSSHICANLTKNFWPLLNQPASHGPFRPKLWMPLATIFVEIFQKGKNWWGSGPIGVTSWKDFSIPLKKWHFLFFLKSHFFHDIQNSFQWATGIGLEPNQNFFRKKIPTNTVARAVQSFGRNGPWQAGWLSNGQNFDVNLAKSPDKEMLKISSG